MKRPRFGLIESFVLFFGLFAASELLLDHFQNIAAARKNTEMLFLQASKNVKSEFGYVGEAVVAVLKTARAFRAATTSDVTGLWSANELIITYLSQYPFISSMNFGDAAGNGYLILRAGGQWRNRIKTAAETGSVTWLTLNEKGKVGSSEKRADTYDPRERSWYQDAVSRQGVAWSAPYLLRTTRDVGITASMQLHAGLGSKEVAGIDIMLKDMSNFLADITAGVNGMAAHLVAQDGTVIACSEVDQFISNLRKDDATLARLDDGGYPLASAAVKARSDDQAFWTFTFNTRRFLASSETVSFTPDRAFNLVLTVPEDALGGTLAHDALWRLAIFFILLSAASALYVFRYLMPIKRIAAAIEDFGAGKSASLAKDAARKNEIGALASEFMNMTHALSERDSLLHESKEKYKEIFSSIMDVFYRTDREGLLLLVSPSVERLLGYVPAEVVGKNLSGFYVHPEERAQFISVLQEKGEVIGHESRLRSKDGSEVWVSTHAQWYRDSQGNIVGVQGISRDITARRRAEEEKSRLEDQLRQAQKVEAIGRLAGGVAHDFNNLTAIVLGYGEMLLDKLPAEDPARKWAEQIVEAGRRSAALTRQLLAFSRRQTLQPEVLDLNALLRNFQKMLGRLIGENIALELRLAAELGRVTADPGQIEQVVTNLVVNARDAMPLGGRLTVETADIELDGTYALYHESVVPGSYVMLAVSDSGCGFDKATAARLFEPFYTTKEKGKGTGLGLATVYGIVKQSGGYLYAYAEPGFGATFKIYLPRTEAQAKVRTGEVDAPVPRGAGERVLLVEDEDPLRELCATVLTDLGYRVSAAASGTEALLLVREKSFEPDLVITDVIMPGLSGAELSDQLRRDRPGLGVLYMSGYTDHALAPHGVLAPGTPFIQKPFTVRAIAVKVREMLAGKAAGAPSATPVGAADNAEA